MATVLSPHSDARPRSPKGGEPRATAPASKAVYSPDQQVKYLHLQAEIDTLMLELQARKQQQQKLVAAP